ncbi:hypothetical protein BGZ83_004502 [Gryganskiella cystojenkinii]|nr:hypothetical protein BGZ83_004502 [Gryganskiella cystojenkinii]
MDASTTGTTSNLDRCLELLRPGTADESKFIGLTLMSELLQTDQDPKTITRFFESIDFKFLDRMLQIEEDSVPKDAGVDATTIRSIALDILTCFSSNGDLLIRKEFKDRVPTMLRLLSASDDTDNSEKILKILIRITTFPQIAMVLTNPRYQSSIITYILATFDKKTEEPHKDAVMVCQRTFLNIQEGYKQNAEAVLQITKEFLPTVMDLLSTAFSHLKETHKADILHLIAGSLAYLPEAYMQRHTKDHPSETKIWTKNLKSGLIQLLSTRQTPATRDDCFKLIGVLLQRLGPSWLFPDPPSKKSVVSKKTSPASLSSSMESLSLSDSEIDKKFAALVVHLTCVEVRVLMDELAEDLPSGNSAKGADTEKTANSSTTNIRREQVLPFAYEILEVSIGYLVRISESDGPEYGLFDATGLLKIQESLQSTFAAILDYLRDLHTGTKPEQLASNMVYLASLRILSVWLMEDDSLHGQASYIVPTLESVVRYCKSKSSQKSLLRLLEPILERFHELSLDD